VIFKIQQQNQRLFKNLNLALQIVFVLALTSAFPGIWAKGRKETCPDWRADAGRLGAIMIWLNPYLGLTVAAASLALKISCPKSHSPRH